MWHLIECNYALLIKTNDLNTTSIQSIMTKWLKKLKMYFYSLIRNIIIQITKSPTTDPSTEDKVDHRQKLLKLEKRETRFEGN